MKTDSFNDFIYMFLVNASQMAYIEEAQKTHDMLQQFNELYRYMIKNEKTVLLSEEIKALRIYINIQSTRYEGRFNITIANSLENSDSIKHLCLLDFLNKTLDKALAEYEGYFRIFLKFISEEYSCIVADLEYGSMKESFKMCIPEIVV